MQHSRDLICLSSEPGELAREQILFKKYWQVLAGASVPAIYQEDKLFVYYFSKTVSVPAVVVRPVVVPVAPILVVEPVVEEETPVLAEIIAEAVVELTPYQKFKQGLQRTRQTWLKGVVQVLQGKTALDAETREALETQLLTADVGLDATDKILEKLSAQLTREILQDPQKIRACLEQILFELLNIQQTTLLESHNLPAKPYVVLMVGVNGVGKTTSIGKLAKQQQQKGRSVMLAAGDTFRAAAVEQLKVWGERNQVPVIAQDTGADSASVIFDALQAAQAREVDLLVADTAGRLHNKSNLMEELKKVKRVLQKLDAQAPHEIILVIDASTGQNALNQVQEFHQAVGLTSVALTKLDGTAKGGVVLAVCEKFGLPVSYIGLGEKIDDWRPFDARAFAQALVGE